MIAAMIQTALHSSKKTLIHLSLIDGIGPVTVKKLLASLPKSMQFSDLYTCTVSDLIHKFGISLSVSQKIVQGLKDTSALEKEVALLEKYGFSVVTSLCESYPKLLTEIYAPPVVLYFKGSDFFEEEKSISIIGSRNAHRYAEEIIYKFVPELVCDGWTIVSGGAIGADSMAHQAAVQAGGKTIAILGSGLLRPYPASNKKLFESIVETGGALVSSFSLQTEARPGNFPIRNRIIAGLSRGCLVVQAAKKSGTRITAQFALEQGRELFAVPGSIDDPLSAGCHALIQEGAKLVGSVDDILEEFHGYAGVKKSVPVMKKSSKKPSRTCPGYHKPELKLRQTVQGPVLKGIQKTIWKSCKTAQSADDIARLVGESLEVVQEQLFDLQLEGHIKQDFSGLWTR